MSKEKIISSILIVLSAIMMFCGWIVADDRKEIVQMVDMYFSTDDIQDELDDMADELEDLMDDADINLGVKPKYVVDSVMDVVGIILDGAISPSEVATKFNKMAKVVKKVSKLNKSDRKALPYQLREFDETFKEIVGVIKVFRFFFFLTLLLHLLFIVLHILDKRILGITLIFTQLMWWIGAGIITAVLNDGYDVVHLSIAPFLSFAFVIAAMIVWIKGRPAKALPQYSQPYMASPAQAPVYNQPAQAKAFCTNCGAEVSPGARFCPVCGTSR